MSVPNLIKTRNFILIIYIYSYLQNYDTLYDHLLKSFQKKIETKYEIKLHTEWGNKSFYRFSGAKISHESYQELHTLYILGVNSKQKMRYF